MSTTRRTTQFLLLFAAYTGLLLFLIVLQGILDAADLLSLRVSWLPFLILHFLLLITLLVAIFLMINSGRQQQWLQQHGRPATARLLDMQRTGWRVKKRGGGSLRWHAPGGPRHEYRLRLEITPPDAGPYELTTHQYLYLNQLPQVGDTVPIKIHPQHLNLVVLVDDASL
jgi:hypothetical protein